MTLDIFNKLAQEESDFIDTQFFGPVFSNNTVRVKISGIVTDFKVPRNFTGWGIFKVDGMKTVRLIREASRTEINQYLDMFPKSHLIVCEQGQYARGISATQDQYTTHKLVSIYLANDIRLFDQVTVISDGANFIFTRINRQQQRNADYLRESLTQDVAPDKIAFKGLTQQERVAYAMIFELQQVIREQDKSFRIKRALERGNAVFQNFRERGNDFVVEFTIDGQRHRSTVDQNLNVLSAGICLNGGDRTFDLQSLATVIREGQDTGQIYRVGGNR